MSETAVPAALILFICFFSGTGTSCISRHGSGGEQNEEKRDRKTEIAPQKTPWPQDSLDWLELVWQITVGPDSVFEFEIFRRLVD